MIRMTENKRRTDVCNPVSCSIGMLFILCLLAVPLAWGDYQDGRMAYSRGDYATTLEELRPLAERGNASAQYFIGYMYYKGQGVKKNYAEAVIWLRKAAEQGDARAQLFLRRIGNKSHCPDAKAAKWLRKAAEQGDANAQLALAGRYFRGHGVAKDDKEAAKWLHKAAEQGHAKSQFALANRYFRGHGVAKDDKEAAKWFRKAAEQGYVLAQFTLGRFYVTGMATLSVSKDVVEAHKWLSLSAAQDHTKAREKRDEIAKLMTAEQLAKAERRACEWEWKRIEKKGPE